jgi:hypothetical protein
LASACGTKFFPISTWSFSALLRRKSITWLARLNFSSLSYEKIPALILDHYVAPKALGGWLFGFITASKGLFSDDLLLVPAAAGEVNWFLLCWLLA